MQEAGIRWKEVSLVGRLYDWCAKRPSEHPSPFPPCKQALKNMAGAPEIWIDLELANHLSIQQQGKTVLSYPHWSRASFVFLLEMTFNSHERIFLNFKNHIRLWEIVRLSPSFWSDAKAGRPRPATRSHAREARNVIISQEQIMYSKNIRGKGRVKHKQGSGIKASLALPFCFVCLSFQELFSYCGRSYRIPSPRENWVLV